MYIHRFDHLNGWPTLPCELRIRDGAQRIRRLDSHRLIRPWLILVALAFCSSARPDPGGAVVTWGRNSEGQSEVVTPNADFVAVVAAEYDGPRLKRMVPPADLEGPLGLSDGQSPPGAHVAQRCAGAVQPPTSGAASVGRGVLEAAKGPPIERAPASVRACPIGVVTFLDPPDGVVDARQPHLPDDATSRQGINVVLVEAPAGADDPACWSLCETVVDGTPNAIFSILDNGDGSFSISLDRTISIGAVTTITYTDSGATAHTGTFTSHPANVNADGASQPSDILHLIDCLNGVTISPWGLYSEDTDHSGLAAPADILRLIELLNGCGEFDVWLSTTLPENLVCP